jgi:hypothetical protein
MIESKYVKKLTCDACGRSIEVYCDKDSMTALSEHAIDWMNIRFDSLHTTEYTYKHLCPDCTKKFLAIFEKSEEKEEPDNVDADGNEKRCDKCFYYERDTRYIGKCTHISKFVAAISHCSDYSGM